MAISKQSNHCNRPVGHSDYGIARQYACDLFVDSERMFGCLNLGDADVAVTILRHEVVRVTVTLSKAYPLTKRRKRVQPVAAPIMPIHAAPVSESELSHMPIDMTDILKEQFSQLLKHSAISHGEWRFILEAGKVRWIVPAPSIMNKDEEIPLLARFFLCRNHPA
jgi:hypothetical protein